MNYFVHPSAICDSTTIGSGTRIWAFTHILDRVEIGEDCNICDFVYIESGVRLGNRVTVKSGVQIWEGVEIGDDVFIGPNVTFTNDKYPKSRNARFKLLKTTIKSGASLGANATILPGLTIGRNAIVGAGSVVAHDVDDNETVFGSPARTRRRFPRL
jgi:acetyltransferase-like isoleucine patch superfamily enzyme